jgi:hypothetical protein
MRPVETIQEWGKEDKGDLWRGWTPLWYIWHIVSALVNAKIYPQHNKKNKKWNFKKGEKETKK